MTLLQCLDSGGNVTAVLILYSRTNILPLLNQCSTAGSLQLLSFHSGCIILPLLSHYYMAYMTPLLSLHYGIHIMPPLSKLQCTHDKILIPTSKGNTENYTKYWTIVLISHTKQDTAQNSLSQASKYVNRYTGLRKGKGTRDYTAQLHCLLEEVGSQEIMWSNRQV